MKKCKQLSAFLLAFILTSTFSACNSNNGSVSPTQVVTQPSVTDSSESVLPANILTVDDIKQKYNDTKVINIKNVNQNFVLVESQREGAANRFDLYDLKTGEMDTLPTMPNFVTLKNILSENYFIFEATGKNSESIVSSFPYIIRCFRVKSNKTNNFIKVQDYEYYNLDKSVQAGSKKDVIISDINVTFKGIEVMFKSSGEESDYYNGASDIAPTKTLYNKDESRMVFEISTILLDKNVSKNIEIEGNEYISSYKVVTENGKTSITVTLKDTVKGYYIQKGRVGFPYFEVKFTSEKIV